MLTDEKIKKYREHKLCYCPVCEMDVKPRGNVLVLLITWVIAMAVIDVALNLAIKGGYITLSLTTDEVYLISAVVGFIIGLVAYCSKKRCPVCGIKSKYLE